MRAQASFEALIAVILLMVTLVSVVYAVFSMSAQAEDLSEIAGQKLECSKLILAFNNLESSKENASVRLDFLYDFNISGDYMDFGSYYCVHRGLNINANISKGTVTLLKQNGVISVSNV